VLWGGFRCEKRQSQNHGADLGGSLGAPQGGGGAVCVGVGVERPVRPNKTGDSI